MHHSVSFLGIISGQRPCALPTFRISFYYYNCTYVSCYHHYQIECLTKLQCIDLRSHCTSHCRRSRSCFSYIALIAVAFFGTSSHCLYGPIAYLNDILWPFSGPPSLYLHTHSFPFPLQETGYPLLALLSYTVVFVVWLFRPYRHCSHINDTHEDQYEAELLRHYKGLIHDRVGHELEALPDIKNIRVSTPEKYSGEDDIEVFDTWLNRLLCWFWVYNVTWDHKDSMRVDLCGTTLTGLAATRYADEVEAWNWRTRKWYIENLICSMYKQFIHEVTMQNTANSYARTKFLCSKGALVFYNELQCHASRMVQPPDEYSMKRKFLKGLPEDLVENLLKSRRPSAEHTSPTTLLCEVKAMESSLQAFQNYKRDRAERLTAPRNNSNSNSQNTSNNRTPRIVWFVKSKQESYPLGNPQNSHDRGPTTWSGSYDPHNRPTGGNNYNCNKYLTPFGGMYPLLTIQLTWQFLIFEGPSKLGWELVVAIVDRLASHSVISILYGLADSYNLTSGIISPYSTSWPRGVREVLTPSYSGKLN